MRVLRRNKGGGAKNNADKNQAQASIKRLSPYATHGQRLHIPVHSIACYLSMHVPYCKKFNLSRQGFLFLMKSVNIEILFFVKNIPNFLRF